MRFTFHERMRFSTDQDIEFVKKRLIINTEPWQNEAMREIRDIMNARESSSSRFEVKIKRNNFTLRRIEGRSIHVGYKPIVKGKIRNRKNKTIVFLSVRPPIVTMIIFSFVELIGLLIILSSLSNVEQMSYGLFWMLIIYIPAINMFSYHMKHYSVILKAIFTIDENSLDPEDQSIYKIIVNPDLNKIKTDYN